MLHDVLNKYTKRELLGISGIGEAMADHIISAREAAKFESLDDVINRVERLGERKAEEISEWIKTGRKKKYVDRKVEKFMSSLL